MNRIMVDIETMGVCSRAPIVAIGAVLFDENELLDEFYTDVSLQSCIGYGAVMDAETVLWWLGQNEVAREIFINNDISPSLPDALQEFSNFVLTKDRDIEVWGNGPAFDNVILRSAYRSVCAEAPWHYWNDRCYRTLKALNKHVTFERVGTHHNALDDAKSQAKHLIKILKESK